MSKAHGAATNTPTSSELKERLTPQQYACTQEAATERPFANAYWDNHAPGLYVDVVDGTPLFSSRDKFDSHSGWPSFTRPLSDDALASAHDGSHGMVRTEVLSKKAKSHLGHVFDDGPMPTRQRFCINSASLRFVPLERMKAEGYEHHLFAFAEEQHWEVATLAGGCFWGVEELFEKEPGVLATEVGYTGGENLRVGYKDVCTGATGHAEAVRILFDPQQTSYTKILRHFFSLHDPTTPNRQANDRGTQYRSAIFYANDKQRAEAEKLIAYLTKIKTFGAPIVTEVVPQKPFVPAEPMHQHYLEHNPSGYRCHVVKPLALPDAL